MTADEINKLLQRASTEFASGSVATERAAEALRRFGQAAAKVPDDIDMRLAVLRAEYGIGRFMLMEYWRLAHNTGEAGQ